MRVHQILANKPIDTIWHVSPGTSMYEALEIMAEHNIGALLVLENQELVGIFSERDYARKGILKGRASKDTLIKDVMTSRVITVSTEHKIEECMGIMSEKHIRHLPVVNDQTLVGIISINDIVSAIIWEQKAHIQSLESYISGNPYS
ncbi:CBS domain-containing protein [Rhabdobacter roseus]|uniref:CBS domain-containing protein n=1 Tax=Rhabdobacter roseus TaxID=1655419 RepID=A0A840TV09_9BACT|nr:CBS domain-containing protein [Rhabdobacter roseus]MBB5283509.1 CBS domain-containing protein [Rhabdobacter roseus]